MPNRSRRYGEARKLVEERDYEPEEALQLLKKMANAKFNETVELHMYLNADPRKQNQQIRETTALPKGTGKKTRLVVFANAEHAEAAKAAGADYVADDELIAKIEKGWVDFDAAVASQDMMPRIAKLGRVLGRRGLMPSPRSGTVVKPEDLVGAVEAARRGRIELRMDKTACIHAAIGASSFEPQDLLENLRAVCGAIFNAKPSDVKGSLVKSASVCATMSPAVKLDVEKLEKLAVGDGS